MTKRTKAIIKSYFNTGDIPTEEQFADMIDTLFSSYVEKGVALTLYTSVISQADTDVFQSNPTIAAGDFKISKDGGALANLTTLPAVTPASSKIIQIALSADEMDADDIVIIGSDASGSEWQDIAMAIKTVA
jgi:hypothetical protein